MAVRKLGNCAYIYGISGDPVAQMTLETKSVEKTPEFEAEATDDEGNVAAVVQGGDKTTFTCGGYTKDTADLDSHSCRVTIDGLLCHVEKWSISRTNNDFAKCELTAVNYPIATVCCPPGV